MSIYLFIQIDVWMTCIIVTGWNKIPDLKRKQKGRPVYSSNRQVFERKQQRGRLWAGGCDDRQTVRVEKKEFGDGEKTRNEGGFRSQLLLSRRSVTDSHERHWMIQMTRTYQSDWFLSYFFCLNISALFLLSHFHLLPITLRVLSQKKKKKKKKPVKVHGAWRKI